MKLPVLKSKYQLFGELNRKQIYPFALIACCFALWGFTNDMTSTMASAFSTAWGCVCGIRHMRLDWENEIEVVKQSAAVAIYMLPNMFVVMGLIVLMVVLGLRMDHRLLTLLMTAIASALAALCYGWAMALTKKIKP